MRLRRQAGAYAAGDGFRTAFENAPIGTALVSAEGRYLRVNSALCELTGYSESRLLDLTISDLTHPDDLAATLERKRRQIAGSPSETRIEKRYIRADGSIVWVAVSSTLVRDAGGSPCYSVAQIENISERVLAQEALTEAEERFRRAFDDAPIGMALVAPNGRWLRVNQTLTEITGYGESELLEQAFQDITHPDDLELDLAEMESLLAGEIRSYRIEKRYLRPDGQPTWVTLSVSLVRDVEGAPLYFISQVEDISERKRAERELKRLAEHDSLTGLLNRRRFQEELHRELQRIKRQRGEAALLYIDVDHFKHVNDTSGHDAGDQVLQAIGRRLVARLRATDLVARLGGDEFAVLLVDTDVDTARLVAAELSASVRATPVRIAATVARVTVSIGVVGLGVDTVADEAALIAADNAMYEAKRSGRDRVTIAA